MVRFGCVEYLYARQSRVLAGAVSLDREACAAGFRLTVRGQSLGFNFDLLVLHRVLHRERRAVRKGATRLWSGVEHLLIGARR